MLPPTILMDVIQQLTLFSDVYTYVLANTYKKIQRLGLNVSLLFIVLMLLRLMHGRFLF